MTFFFSFRSPCHLFPLDTHTSEGLTQQKPGVKLNCYSPSPIHTVKRVKGIWQKEHGGVFTGNSVVHSGNCAPHKSHTVERMPRAMVSDLEYSRLHCERSGRASEREVVAGPTSVQRNLTKVKASYILRERLKRCLFSCHNIVDHRDCIRTGGEGAKVGCSFVITQCFLSINVESLERNDLLNVK